MEVAGRYVAGCVYLCLFTVCVVYFDCLLVNVLLPNALGAKIAQASGAHGRIFIGQFRPDSDTHFVTVGVRHIKFWTVAGSQLLGQRGVIPQSAGAQLQTMLSVAFAPVSTTSVRLSVYLSLPFMCVPPPPPPPPPLPSLPSGSCPLHMGTDQNNMTYTGSVNGDIYEWKGSGLARVIPAAHTGPVFAMYTCLEDGLMVTGGKEKR